MDISPKQLMEAIEQIAYDRKIPAERILETVEAALAAAYRKDFGHPEQMIRVKLNAETGETEVYEVFEVVAKKDDVENEHTQITVTEAKKQDKEAKTGGELMVRVTPPEEYGRIAAQTAKQVIIQRIREVEREIVQEEFAGRDGELLTGAVQRIEGRNVFVEIGRALGVMRPEDQIQRERYYIGQRLRVLLRELDPEGRGAQLILSRSNPDFVRRLFELEVPEIHAGTVEIASIAREAGVRTKVAVKSNQEGVDPVGTCVGQRGTRVQAIMAELGEEKIDIVLYDEDPVTYIMNALSPAKISRIDLHEDAKTADIIVADDQLSLAIGRGGQNVRLAGDLTGWQLDIEKTEPKAGDVVDSDEVVAGMPIDGVPGVTEQEAVTLTEAGLGTAQLLAAASGDDLAKVDSIEPARRVEIQAAAADAISGAGAAGEPEAEAQVADESEVSEEVIAEEVADAAVEDAEEEIAETPADDPEEPSEDDLVEVEELADEAKADAAKDTPTADAKSEKPAEEKSAEPTKAEEKGAEESATPSSADEGASDEASKESSDDDESK